MQKAYLAGGCFWCMVDPFSTLPGVSEVTAGYMGGHTEYPTYDEVCRENTGHKEAVEILYDPRYMSYEKLLDVFFKNIDPTDAKGQFADRGRSYTTAIFTQNQAERTAALKTIKALETSGRFKGPIVTEVLEYMPFYPAEPHHQMYHLKNPFHYQTYKKGSGRADYLKETWSMKIDKKEMKKKLTPTQFNVVFENGTEPPFQNEFHDFKGEGIYVDIVTGDPLFSSTDKFDSGSGWPSFTKPIQPIQEKMDTSHGMRRIEVRTKASDIHLGHVFEDGPADRGGLRYCINSAALRFVAKEDLEKEGYGEYLALFE